MNMHISNRSSQLRYHRVGTTLVEVMFSIGVVLIGLVGLVAVIPVAGRRAEDSVALNTGSALSASAFNSLTARGLGSRSQWIWRNDAGVSFPVLGSGIAALSSDDAAYCLDPLFLTAPTIPTDKTGYRRVLFPYYKTTYNPLADPSLDVTDPWPAQPRMWRVSIDRSGTSGIQLISVPEAETIVESGDEISQAMPEDNTLAAVAVGKASYPTDGGYGKRTTAGKYTWFATFNRIPGSSYTEVSTVIVKSRNRGFYTPQNGDPPADTEDDNATGERLAYVESASGFSGGAGGTVTIGASQLVDSKVVSNDWVMLSTFSGTTPIHQWYRVTGAIGDAEEISGYSVPAISNQKYDVWKQQLMLDGPDFSFSGLTVMTIVQDVVSVSRHTMPLSP